MAKTDSKQKMLHATRELLQERGYYGTAMRDIVTRSSAPAGSVYHHFPGGKEQLALEAVQLESDEITAMISHAMFENPDLVSAWNEVVETFARQIEDSETDLCNAIAPLAIAPPDSPSLQAAVSQAYGTWQTLTASRLAAEGLPPERAEALAWTALSVLEGAMIISRARRDAAPLRLAGQEMALYLTTILNHAN